MEPKECNFKIKPQMLIWLRNRCMVKIDMIMKQNLNERLQI